MTSYTGSVYKGAELDSCIRRPAAIIKHLQNAGLLPLSACVVRVELPSSSKIRSALFGVKFLDLANRQEAICDFIDQPMNSHMSPLTGNQTISLLSEMMAHAHVHSPELIRTDAMLQMLCQALKVPGMYKALTSGGAEGFTLLVNAVKENDR